MKLPDQVQPGANRASQAPYNFVPLAEPPYEPSDALPDHDRHALGPDRLSGQIEITLRTETWLYTRAAVPPKRASDDPQEIWNEDSPYRDFFHHGDPGEPVVPGSSLRGMLRQLVEVLSDGRLDTASGDPIVYRAVGDTTRFGWFYRRRFVGPNTDPDNRGPGRHINPNPTNLPQRLEYPLCVPDPKDPYKRYAVHGGYLFREGRRWYIRPAKRFPAGSDETFVHVDASALPACLQPWQEHLGEHAVWVVPSPRTDHRHPKRIGRETKMLTLHHALTDKVWVRVEGDEKPNEVDERAEPAILVVTDGLRDRHGIPVNKHMHCAIFEPDPKRRIDVPPELQRLYLEDRGISRADDRKGRLLRKEPPVGSPNGERVPCFYMVDANDSLTFFGGTLFFRLPYERAPSAFQHDPGAPDLAGRVFGTLAGPGGKALKGRVRFEDLTWDRTQGPSDPFVGIRFPQPLLAPKPACIQHYLVQASDDRNKLVHYDDHPYHEPGPTGETTALRGFKHYWHRKDPDEPDRVTAEHMSVQPPEDRPRTKTVIRPVKERVTFCGRIHFDNLSPVELGALLVALDLKPNLRHKLGMARPFGFGSVRIERKRTRIVDPAERYGSFFSKGEHETDEAGTDCLPDAVSTAGLEAGWKPDSETTAIGAKRAFYAQLARFRGAAVADDASETDASRAFWSSGHMRELAALLEWDQRPDWHKTAQVLVPHAQWKERRVLPPPRSLVPQDPDAGASPRVPRARDTGVDPSTPAAIRSSEPVPAEVRAASPLETSSTSIREAFLAAEQVRARRARERHTGGGAQAAPSRAASAAVPVRLKEVRTGTLAREGTSWVAVLDGGAGTAEILNEDAVPESTPPGSSGRFRVERATAYAGIQVIYEGPAE